MNRSLNGHSAVNGDRKGSADHIREPSIVESTVGDSFQLVSILEPYRSHLPRRKGHRRKVAEGCWGLSCISWLFLFLSLFQFLAVSGLQITIAALGRFRERRLEEYVACLQSSLKESLNDSSFSLPSNFSAPRFGNDKEIYVYFFIVLVLYNFCLCVYALTQKNIVEVFSFMALNILAMAYACLQVYQFRGFGRRCEAITLVGYLAMANAFILLVFTILFALLSITIYVEFGWKIYRILNCNPAMRYYHRVYQTLMSLIKIVILFLLMFTIGQCILVLTVENYEFGLTIVISVAILVLAFPIVYLVVTYEWRLGYVAMFACVIILFAYCIFKIYRFATRSCPLCEMSVQDSMDQIQMVRDATGLQNSNISNEMIANLFSLDRVEDFGNLIMLASLVLLSVIVALIVFIHHLRFYNKGLKDYFAEQQPNAYLNSHCFKRWYGSGEYEVKEEKVTRLQLTTKFRSHGNSTQTHVRDSQLEESEDVMTRSGAEVRMRRDSSLDETFTMPSPNFNNAPPTVQANSSKVFK